ncbi:MAG TPA: glycosyltransferase family 39 protein [Gemmatimonadales bacterium]|nr:glycosyltransferase family 39 protein [Gemmatimonadales bacterium]
MTSRINISGLAALALVGVAVVLPPVTLARALTGGPPTDAVVSGLWLFKGALLALALVVWLAPGICNRERPALDPAGPPPGALGGHRVGTRLMLGGMLLLGSGLRLHGLGAPLWFDEIQTLVDYVRQPIGHIVTTFDSQNQHLLYSVLARAAVVLGGESNAMVRLPAAVFGVLSLWAVYWFGRMITCRREALLATLLLTVSYHHVWFSQDARGYTGLLFWTLLASGLFLRLLRDPGCGWGTVAGYGLALAGGVYTHSTALFVALAHGLIALGLWLRQGRSWAALARPLTGLVAGGVFTLVLYAPVAPQFLRTLVQGDTGTATTATWQSPLWLARETLAGLARGLPGGWPALGLAILVVAVGVGSYLRRSVTVALLLLLPGVLTGGAVLALHHNLWPRFFFFAAGFAVLVALRGGFAIADRLLAGRWSALPVGAVLLVATASLWTVPRAWGPKQDYRAARDWVRARADSGDAVVTVDLTRYPCERFYACSFTGVDTVEQLEAVEGQHRATWVLYTFPIRLAAAKPAVWRRLQADYGEAAVFPGTVGGGAIVVVRRPPPAS